VSAVDAGVGQSMLNDSLHRAAEATEANDWMSAKACYREALKFAPKQPKILNKFGEVCVLLGHTQEAHAAFNTVLGLPRNAMEEIDYQIAVKGTIVVLVMLGQLDRVAGLLADKTIGRDLDVPLTRFLLLALGRTGNFDRLASCFAPAMRIKTIPMNPGELGAALVVTDHVKDGLRYLEMWLSSNPGDLNALVQYVRTLACSGLFPARDQVQARFDALGFIPELALYRGYQLARYYDMRDDLALFETEDDPGVWHERVNLHPGVTGLSRMEFRPDAIARNRGTFKTPEISVNALRNGVAGVRELVRTWRAEGRFDVQLANIAAVRDRFGGAAQDPVQILSTGRCGTRSLFSLCQRSSSVLPFHSFELTTLPIDRNHLLFRMMTGHLDKKSIAALAEHYLQSRTAELIYAYRTGRTPVIISHWDTVFAPFVAEMFPESRFLFLWRDEMAVFKSIYGKNQWQSSQLMPLQHDPAFPNGRFVCQEDPSLDIESQISWYLQVTRAFAEAFLADIAPGRGLSLLSETFFAGAQETLEQLQTVLPLTDIDPQAFAEHLKTPQNAKETAQQVDPEDLQRRAERVPELVDQLARTGAFSGDT